MPSARTVPELMKRLLGKARRGPGAVYPEDLLPLAGARDAEAAAQLGALAARWPRRGRVDGGAARVAPMGRWADYVCAALEGGPPEVVARARREDERRLDAEDGFCEASIALAVLEAIRTEESVRAVLALAADARGELDARRALAAGCAGALNHLTGLEDPVAIPVEVEAEARAFLHALLAQPLSTVELATVCCALRGVGDASSLEVVARLPRLPPPWDGTADLAAKAIRARLRARAPA